jgi:hypothetical protein
MNQIVAALEAYNSDNGSYPDAEGCVGGGSVFDTGLTAYFAGGNAPQDPSGARTADTNLSTCLESSQYYYKYIGDVDIAEYILATKMEIEGNNNTTTPPTSINESTAPDFGCEADPATACEYYVLVK